MDTERRLAHAADNAVTGQGTMFMMRGCGCTYSERRRVRNRRLMRAFVIGFGGYVAVTGLLALLYLEGVIGVQDFSWINLGCLVFAALVLLESAQESRPRLSWRELESSDALQAFFFPLFCAVGWHDAIQDTIQGWRLIVTVAVATLGNCMVALEFVLRIPHRVAEYRAAVFGGRLTPAAREFNLAARRHEMFCVAGDDERWKARIRARALRAARFRKAVKDPAARGSKLAVKFDKYLLAPLENVPLWFSAYTISAALFPILVVHANPGVWSAQLLFAPFALIPPAAIVWQRLKSAGSPHRGLVRSELLRHDRDRRG